MIREMKKLDRTCPKCGNSNYIMSLSGINKTYPFKCYNCMSYLTAKELGIDNERSKTVKEQKDD